VTFGNGWMHRNLIRILRHTDVRILYLFSDIFIVPVCLLFNTNRSRTYSYSFYRRRLRFGIFKSLLSVYRNHCSFAQVVIDRFATYAGKTFDVEVAGQDIFDAHVSGEDGFIHLSSHIGNYEMAGYTLNSDRKPIHAIVYSDEKKSVMDNRNGMFCRTNVSMITMKPDMSHLLEIDEAICRGEIVSFPADRHLAGSRCLTVPFFGSDAAFPKGPFSVAVMRSVDVLAVNVMKDGTEKYRIYVTNLPYDRTLPKNEQVRQLCCEYVSELERRVRQYPAQWYNFYDFWA